MKLKMMKNKKAISELISYVLLITLAIAMAAGVYIYLEFLAKEPLPEQGCEGISVLLDDYKCGEKDITLTIKNNGRFSIYGILVRVYNKNNLTFLNETIPKELTEIKPAGELTRSVSYTGSIDQEAKEIELLPFTLDEKNIVKFCTEAKIIQGLENCILKGESPGGT